MSLIPFSNRGYESLVVAILRWNHLIASFFHYVNAQNQIDVLAMRRTMVPFPVERREMISTAEPLRTGA